MIFEILVPQSKNDGMPYSLEYHKEWDEKVRTITGGVTVQKTSKGSWVKKNGALVLDTMIPVKIFCTNEEFDQIMKLTLEHYYDQETIMGYKISNEVYLLNRKGE